MECKLNIYFSDPCPNGAAYYLFVAGLVILATNLVLIFARISKYCTKLYCTETIRTGYSSANREASTEKSCWVYLLNYVIAAIVIVDFVVIIWVR